MNRKRTTFSALAAALMVSAPVHAAITISTTPTSNMSCSGGVCEPTATDAVLNSYDLEKLLASSNVTVTTTGSGVQATHIDVKANIGWSKANALSLDAYQSITISRTISLSGVGGLTLRTNDGGSNGTLSFFRKGHVIFRKLSSQLTINGTLYTLESTLPSLATAIDANPSGNYALANDYDASSDGTYSAAPITKLYGKFDGVGNKISKLTIASSNGDGAIGLFGVVEYGAVVGDITVNVSISGDAYSVGALAAYNAGTIQDSFASGSLTCTCLIAGGLLGSNDLGKITSSGSSVAVSIDASAVAGGLVGWNFTGVIEDSFATGSVSAADGSTVGGLIGSHNQVPASLRFRRHSPATLQRVPSQAAKKRALVVLWDG